VDSRGCLPVFLMNVPSTWQAPAARQIYRDELKRLGRFLERLGGKAPSHQGLAQTMLAYDKARAALRRAQPLLSGRPLAEAVAGLRGSLTAISSPKAVPRQAAGIPLAVVGGPLPAEDYGLFDLVERAGGRVVLDGTDGGERTLPAPFDHRRVAQDPLEELTDAYFLRMPDVFRRPNDGLYDWLGRHLAARNVRGILFRRYVWCDLWHGELHRLKAWSPVPVLEIDVGHDDQSAAGRTLARIEAFLEMLR
jgi:benzoyl-CoA reductase/2-hydroxyglutaryl-CoA dehydratase subunit BcrC/BadD/HgdB